MLNDQSYLLVVDKQWRAFCHQMVPSSLLVSLYMYLSSDIYLFLSSDMTFISLYHLSHMIFILYIIICILYSMLIGPIYKI